MRAWMAAGWLGLWTGGVASAQEEPSFRIDSVLVLDFEHGADVSVTRATSFRLRMQAAMEQAHLVLKLTEVPPFADYDAGVYLRSCPPGRYLGCAVVLGAHAQVDWVVATQMSMVGEGSYSLRVSYLDVATGELMHEAVAVLDGADDAAMIVQLAQLLDAVIAGQTVPTDLRYVADTQVEVQRRGVETEGLGAEELDADAEAIDRTETEGEVAKVTQDDIDRYESQEGATPWKRLKMTPMQWRRYKNTGAELVSYQKKLQGRQAEISIGTGFQVGKGPWTQHWEGWFGIDQATLGVVERAVSLEQQPGLERTWRLEVAGGVLPWLDVGFAMQSRVTNWSDNVRQYVEGTTGFREESHDKLLGTWTLTGRVGVAPFPEWPARPTMHVGAGVWMGTKPEKAVQPPFPAPGLQRNRLVLLQLEPGGEVDIGRWLRLWARFSLDLPVAGRVAQEDASVGTLLTDWKGVSARSGVGVSGSIGLSARIRLVQLRR